MSIATPSHSAVSPDSSSSYTGPLAVVTTLFFMWGFLTCLNDILVPHLKPIFDLNYAEVMLIQFAFFGAYFLFSIPSAKVIDWMGYQRSMVAGLLTMGVGAFLFVPAASVPSFPLFLVALIVLADTGLQFIGNFSGSFLRRTVDSECGTEEHARNSGDGSGCTTGVSPP
jgi:MFS transporter, FHS family, L-fucose permease